MLSAGRLRHRIELQELTDTQDQNTGEMVSTWETVGRLWAAIEPVSVRDLMAANSEQSKITARITIRYREEIDYKNRIKHKNTIYNIEGVLPDKNSGKEYLTLAVSEGVRFK